MANTAVPPSPDPADPAAGYEEREPDATEVPTERQDRARIEADEHRLEELGEMIGDAHQVHAEQRRRWQSGLLPQAEGDEGEGNAGGMRG